MAVTGKHTVKHANQQQAQCPIQEEETQASMSGVTLIEHILKGICDRDEEQNLFERYLKLKVRYFNQSAKELLGDFLRVKQHQDKSVDEILSCRYRKSDRKELIHIMKLFIAGEFDAIHTARMLERYYFRHKPSVLRVFAGQRYSKLKAFIDNFKTNCMKDIMQENIGFMEYDQELSQPACLDLQQHQSLFPQRVTMASPSQVAATTPKSQRQHRSLFKDSVVTGNC